MSLPHAGHQIREWTAKSAPVEVWGGVECTCNRVAGRYFDQMELSGHAKRPEDLDRFVALGLRTLRMGVLWERHVRDPSWKWQDAWLERARSLGIRPIAGLVHHGSGPRHTSLLDPEFPKKLAAYAAQVAERYPWIGAYTPVNEPDTTGRFSGRYGLWYPHHRSLHSYFRALLHQMKATVLSMAAVRRIQPEAQLIQTEDAGQISGTEKLRPVWERLNLRRWLPFDLLCGRVDTHHPMFHNMRATGIREEEILWFADHPCPPDVIGINYYPTSDRYLDHRTELYPPGMLSSEGRFVDVEAVRVPCGVRPGFHRPLVDTWRRYGIPVAITEVHLGGEVEEQIRWLVDAWKSVQSARASGVSCVAFTVWALTGSYYWNQLVTCENGHYEPGAFDVSTGEPVRTALAEIVEQLAKGRIPRHPALSTPGWWRCDDRFCFPWKEIEQEIAV